MSRGLKVACLLFYIFILQPAESARAMLVDDSSTPVAPTVSQSTGEANFRLPIDVPPGPGGLEPHLTLSYSSHGADGPFGVGWRLPLGLGVIRCSARLGVREAANCPRYEMGGQLLTRDQSTSPSVYRYHPFVENFARILYRPAGSPVHPDSWEVTLPNGRIHRYGLSTNSRIDSQGVTAEWLLAEIEDPFGNRIFYGYEESDLGYRHLQRISYGPEATASWGRRQVVFIYEPRPDPIETFAGGIERNLTQRLREIRVLSYGAVFRRHVFGYDPADSAHSTHRSKLAWTQIYGTDCDLAITDPVTGGCMGLPAQHFEYTDPNDSIGSGVSDQFADEPGYQIALGGSIAFHRPAHHFGDIDGDGLPDRLRTYVSGGVPSIELNNGSGFVHSPEWTAALTGLQFETPKMRAQQRLVVDDVVFWHGEAGVCSGSARLVVPSDGADYLEVPITHTSSRREGAQVGASMGGRSAVITPGAIVDSYIYANGRIFLRDIDADGRAEILLSVRLSGVHENIDCATGEFLPTPWNYVEGKTVSVVYRNTGDPSLGWVRDDALAQGLPAFDEVAFESTGFTEWQFPNNDYFSELNPCNPRGLAGWWGGNSAYSNDQDFCLNIINLAPVFADLNGDGYPDLIALERDNPADRTLWVNDRDAEPVALNQRSELVSRAWVQRPDAGPGEDRWVRDARFDLPSRTDSSPWLSFLPWAHSTVYMDGRARPNPFNPFGGGALGYPATYNGDSGVRFADLNRDGLTDVVWKIIDATSIRSPIVEDDPRLVVLDEGVLINTGRGVAGVPASAWCASTVALQALVGGGLCGWATQYVPPNPGFAHAWNHGNIPVGQMNDLNGDGWLDYLYINHSGPYGMYRGIHAWIHSRGEGAGIWKRDARFDLVPESWLCGFSASCNGTSTYQGEHRILDLNGDGVEDLFGERRVGGNTVYVARLSQSSHPDLIREHDNGRGGTIELTYASAIQQRDPASDLESRAVQDAVDLLESPGAANDSVVWSTAPVVLSAAIRGPNIGDAFGNPAPATTYEYAHPRLCLESRTDLGFRLVEQVKPDGSTLDHFFYQHHGRAGRTSKIEIWDGGEVIRESHEVWQLRSGGVPGSIDHPDVHLGRLVESRSRNVHGGVPGAETTRTAIYDDGYGYNFVVETFELRPTSSYYTLRNPVPFDGSYPVGLISRLREFDSLAGSPLSDTLYSYESGKPDTRWDIVMPRGGPSTVTVQETSFDYDGFGNLRSQAQHLASGDRVTDFCYDGDGGWCPVIADQDSFSVRVGERNALGIATRSIPDAASGTIAAHESDYIDVPGTRTELDPFGRPTRSFVRPEGGIEVMSEAIEYHDDVTPPFMKRMIYSDASAIDGVETIIVSDGFEGVFKTISDTGTSGGAASHVVSMVYRDLENRIIRESLPLVCNDAPLCSNYPPWESPLETMTTSDALGRVLRVDTPDGFSIHAHFAIPRSIESGYGAGTSPNFDVELSKNGKGDLVQKLHDGDRVVWVDECAYPVASGLSDLSSASCVSPDQTFYTYEPTGENSSIFTPRAVASANYSDPNNAIRYSYDSLGRILEIRDGNLEGTGRTSTTYDDAGNVALTTNARGQTRSYHYDALDRLVEIRTPADEPDYFVSHSPSQLQPTQDSAWNQYTKAYTYDGLGRVERKKLSVADDRGSWVHLITDFDYDLLGRPTQIDHPDDATVVAYEYQGAHLKRVCDLGGGSDCSDAKALVLVSDASYDPLGRLKEVRWDSGVRGFSYDPVTQRLSRDRFDSLSSAYWYERNYARYDEIGNLKEVTGASQHGDVSIDESYTYDHRNRLATWSKEGSTTSYGYDSLGNLTLRSDEVQEYADAARPDAITRRVTASGDAEYAYDDDGNIRSIVSAASAQYFRFDSANRLVCIGDDVNADEQVLCDENEIRYDLAGRRVIDIRGPNDFAIYVDESYVYERSALRTQASIEISAFGDRIASKRLTPVLRVAWVEAIPVAPRGFAVIGVGMALVLILWGARRGDFVLVVARPCRTAVTTLATLSLAVLPAGCAGVGPPDQATFHWELTDPLGSGLLILNQHGGRVRHSQFTPFGQRYSNDGSTIPDPKYFAGHRKHADSGLVYMQSRWYDPSAGRFLSIDPVVDDRSPQNHNAYSYVANNPINGSDPTGATPVMDWVGPLGGFGTSIANFLGELLATEWGDTMLENEAGGEPAPVDAISTPGPAAFESPVDVGDTSTTLVGSHYDEPGEMWVENYRGNWGSPDDADPSGIAVTSPPGLRAAFVGQVGIAQTGALVAVGAAGLEVIAASLRAAASAATIRSTLGLTARQALAAGVVTAPAVALGVGAGLFIAGFALENGIRMFNESLGTNLKTPNALLGRQIFPVIKSR